MNLQEAITEMQAGKKVINCKFPNPDDYICMKDGKIVDDKDEEIVLSGLSYSVIQVWQTGWTVYTT